MGMSERQVLQEVELPLSLPLVFAGIRIATIFVIATATIASIAGGDGLGDIIVNQATLRPFRRRRCIAVRFLLAFSAAFLLTLLYRAVSPRPVPSD